MISAVPSVSSVHVELDGRLPSTDGRTDETTKGEVTPDFTYEHCEGSQEEAIGETQKEVEDGLAPCTFPAPCTRACSKDPVLRF